MEYEQFYKFLENRPVKELNQCIHRIVDIVGSRFGTYQPQLESIQQAALNAIASIQKVADIDPEKARVEGILKGMISNGISLPHGMNGYNRKDMRFVRWFPGTAGPVSNSKAFSTEHKVATDWFLDTEFQVWLNWNAEGYFEMSRKDSLKFNQSHAANKYLADEARHGGLQDKRKPESVTGSESRKKSKPSAAAATEEPVRFTYLSSDSQSGTDSEEEHVLKINSNGVSSACAAPKTAPEPMDIADDHSSHNGHPSTPPKTVQLVTERDKAVEKELSQTLSSTSAKALIAPSPKATTQAKPIKGDTVYITGGKYSGAEGSVVGMRGSDGDVYRVQIANLIDGGSIVVQVPGDSITLSRPSTSQNTPDLAEDYLSSLKRVSVAPKSANPSPSPAKKLMKIIRKSSEPRVEPTASAYEAEHENSVDEFFNNLSGSEDYFRAQPPQVSDDASNIAPQLDSSSAATVPKRTSFVLSDDSAPTRSLTTPPDMPRDAETVSTVASAVVEDVVMTAHIDVSDLAEEVAEEAEEIQPSSEGVVESVGVVVETAFAPPAESVSKHNDATPTKPTGGESTAEPLTASGEAAKPQSAASKSPRKKKLTGRPRAHKKGEEEKVWAFKCKCGDMCYSYESPIYHPAGEWFECSQCAVWSHVKCLLGDISLEKVAEMPEVLCFSCMSKARRNRSSRGVGTDSDPHAADLSSVEQADAYKPITLPVKITTTSPAAAARAIEKKRTPKKKAAPVPPAVPLLQPGQIVILLKGLNRGEEAEVIEPARAGPVLLHDVYKLKLCSAPDKVLQMPLEFLTKKAEMLEELDAALMKPLSPVVAPTGGASSSSVEQIAPVASKPPVNLQSSVQEAVQLEDPKKPDPDVLDPSLTAPLAEAGNGHTDNNAIEDIDMAEPVPQIELEVERGVEPEEAEVELEVEVAAVPEESESAMDQIEDQDTAEVGHDQVGAHDTEPVATEVTADAPAEVAQSAVDGVEEEE